MVPHFLVQAESVLRNESTSLRSFSGTAPKWRSGLSLELTGSGQRWCFLEKLEETKKKVVMVVGLQWHQG